MLESYGIGKLLGMIKAHIVNKLFMYILRGSHMITILNSNIKSPTDLIDAFMKKNIKLSIHDNSVSMTDTKTGIERVLTINQKT